MKVRGGYTMRNGRVRIFAIEQNGILREGILALIAPEADIEIAAVRASAENAVTMFLETRPDLTLIDLDLPDNSGLDAIYSIIQKDPQAWIIGLVADDVSNSSRQAIVAGAFTVLAKDKLGNRLLTVIRSGPPSPRSSRCSSPPGEFVQPRLRLLDQPKEH